MTKAYISVSFSKRKELQQEMETISSVLQFHGITAFIFVDQYEFAAAQEKEMMQQAMLSIDACDLLIAETSDKAIGIGIEAGYAKAKGKKLIYLRNINAEHSTTLSGISDFQITYTDTNELRKKLSNVLGLLNKAK